MSVVDPGTALPDSATGYTTAGPAVGANSALSATGISSGTPEQLARQLYGYLASFLDVPEVGDLLRRGANEGWDVTRLEGELSKTEWWQTTQASQREFDSKMTTDPGSVRAQIATQASSLRAELAKEGVTVDDTYLTKLATDTLRNNWSPEQTRAALDSELQRVPGLLASKVGTEYRALSQQYGILMSDPAIQTWAAHSISGIRTDEQYREFLVQQAKGRFQGPNIQRFLDNGGTTKQFFDPYLQMAAQITGVNPDSIDLTDPKWIAAINARDDKGNIREMTLGEWEQYLKTDSKYGYDQTKQAKQDAWSTVADLGRAMGKVA